MKRFALGRLDCLFIRDGPGTHTDDALEKDPAAGLIYDEWFRRLEDGTSFADIADWLNEQGIAPGPYTRSDRWSGPMVGQVTRNPILKGVRVRNRKMAQRAYKRLAELDREEVAYAGALGGAFGQP